MTQLCKVDIVKKAISIVVIMLLFCSGCKKYGNGSGIGGTDSTALQSPLTDFTTKVYATVSGFVTDENDSAINKATVQVGATIIQTDKYGFFKISNANVVKNAATVTVTKNGYFKSTKTWVVSSGKIAFCRIKMMPKIVAGSLPSVSGGSISLPNGLKISLPANSFVNAITNDIYTGNVNVAAYWIDPTSPDHDRIMPGNLSGLNKDNKLQLLASYSMAAIELSGINGELLQLASGKKANIIFPIPPKLSVGAPLTIPLWYFNESNGLWIQEGSATKSGANYTVEVGHFSYWNCDLSYILVQYNCTIVNESGQPIPHARVKISLVDNPDNFTFFDADETGFVSGLVPANTPIRLEVFSTSACGSPVYSKIFTTTYQTASLGELLISSASGVAHISGYVINCGNATITSGEIVVQNGILFDKYPISPDGSFSFNQLVCGSSPNLITIVAIDSLTSNESIAATYSINPGDNSISPIKACTTKIQFISYSINGINYYYSTPGDFFQQQVIGGNTSIYWYYVNNDIELDFLRANIGLGSNQLLFKFSPALDQIPFTPNFTTTAPIMVNITEFGPVNYYIGGNFSGTIIGSDNKYYNVACSFRVLRGD